MKLENFDFVGPAGRLEGVMHFPAIVPRAIVVVAHPLPTMGGTMTNKVVTTLSKAFVELGFIALRFNFRGAGKSEGVYTGGEGELEDFVAVMRYAQQRFGVELPIIFSGFSFGGYVAARAAQHYPPQHLILIAPAVGRFAMPDVAGENVLVIHGEQDEVVALPAVLDWARPQQLAITVLPGSEHFFHGRLMQLRDKVMKYFNGVTV